MNSDWANKLIIPCGDHGGVDAVLVPPEAAAQFQQAMSEQAVDGVSLTWVAHVDAEQFRIWMQRNAEVNDGSVLFKFDIDELRKAVVQ